MSRSAPLPPRDLGAEEYVLGAMMLAGCDLEAIGALLEPGDFYRPSNGVVYGAMLEMRAARHPIDPITVIDQLKRLGVLGKIAVGGLSGPDRIREIASLVPAVSNAVHHAKIVRRMARRREEDDLGRALQEASANGGLEDDVALRQRLAGLLEDPFLGSRRPWFLDAADLLAKPDPGRTKWLVDGLIPDRALVAAVGRWKVTKSYATLDISIAIATGRPAFGRFLIPEPGLVVFVNEESGEAALWRRLDALCRGRAIPSEELRDKLIVAPNAGVKLDDPRWQNELLALGKKRRPKLFVFDPLARMKAPDRNENEQVGVSALIDFIRDLREATGAGVLFVHHTGHQGSHMRGSSDLESFWETRLTWTRDGQSPLVKIESEHREAEAGEPVQYRIAWDADTRTMRFNFVDAEDDTPPLASRILEHIGTHGPGTTDEVRRGVGVRRQDVQRTLEELEQAGTVHRGRSGHRDAAGRLKNDKTWNLSNQAGLRSVPDARTNQDAPAPATPAPSRRPTLIGGARTDGAPDGPSDLSAPKRRLLLGDPGYALYIDSAYAAGHLTQTELREQIRLDAFVCRGQPAEAGGRGGR